jgi:hypothetical protein
VCWDGENSLRYLRAGRAGGRQRGRAARMRAPWWERRTGPVLDLPPGASVLELRSSTPPTGAGAGRPLGFVFYGIELEVLADAMPPKK